MKIHETNPTVVPAGVHPKPMDDRQRIDRSWRWYMQLLAERLFSPIRIFAMVAVALCWLFEKHPAGSNSTVEWVVIGAGLAFSIVNELVLRSDLALPRQFPYGTVIADIAILGASLWASGGRASPFQFFIIAGVASASLRIAVLPAIVTTAVYVMMSVTFGDADSIVEDAILVAIMGIGIALWSEAIKARHVAAVRDPLTGSYSRDFGLMRLRDTLARGAFPFTVAVVDLDGLKQVNDVYGHAAGDLVLRQVARVMTSVLRADDFLCRFGGDEFMLVFHDVDLRRAVSLGERLRAEIETTRIGLRAEHASVSVTLSVGLAEAKSGETAASLIKAADDAMYLAKKKTNRVVASHVALPAADAG